MFFKLFNAYKPLILVPFAVKYILAICFQFAVIKPYKSYRQLPLLL